MGEELTFLGKEKARMDHTWRAVLRFAQNAPLAVIRAGEDYPDGFILQVHGG